MHRLLSTMYDRYKKYILSTLHNVSSIVMYVYVLDFQKYLIKDIRYNTLQYIVSLYTIHRP